MLNANYRAALATALVVLLVACSGLKTYPNDLTKNLRVHTRTSAGSVFQKLNASLHIYDVDGQCQAIYVGTVALDRAVIEVGVPVQKQVYLEFAFEKSARFYSSSSIIDVGTLLRARPAHQYVIDVSYIDDMYKMSVRDKSVANGMLERRSLETCVR